MHLNLTRLLLWTLLVAAAAAPRASAQTWQDLTASLPGAPKVGTGQSIASTGTELFLLSSPNGLLRSTDNGGTWTPLNTVTGNANDLSAFGSRSVDATGTTVWAGGEPGSLALTGGVVPLHRLTGSATAWTPSFSGATAPAVIDAVAYDAVTRTHWAAAALGGIYRSTDGGTTWTAANGDLPGTSCRSIVAHNGKAIAAITGTGGGAFTSTDGGTTWVRNAAALPQPGYLVNIGDLVYLAGTGDTTLTTGVYFSRDFGATWQFSQVDTLGGLKILTNPAADSTTMFAGGTAITSLAPLTYTPTVAFSQNGGTTWDDLPATGLPTGVGRGVERLCRHGSYLFALTGDSKLYRLDLTGVSLTPTLKIAVPPQPAKAVSGGTLTMKVYAGGPGTLAYQWQRGGADVAGQTSDTLTLAGAQVSDTGNYTCTVTAGGTSVTSAAARGTVVDRIEGRYDPTLDRTGFSGGDTGTPFLQSDGSVVVGTSGGVYRIGPNGTKTDSRAIGGSTGYNGRLVDSAGRVVLGGLQGNTSTHRIRRLLGTAGFPDDPAFPQVATNSATNATIRGLRELPGSGYLVWGDFSQLGPAGGTLVTVPRLALVNYDGSLNTTFNTNIQTIVGLGASATALPLPDGTAWVTNASGNVTRVNASGQKVSGHTDYTVTTSETIIHASHVLASGKLLIGLGSSGTSRGLRLLNTDGTLDTAFNAANVKMNSAFSVAAEQADGKIVVAGSFTTFGSNACNGRIMRLNADGTFDASFYNATGFGTTGGTGIVYDPRGYFYLLNEANNATTGGFQDSATIGDTIGRNLVRIFGPIAPGYNAASWLSNLSVRAATDATRTLIVGFVVEGDAKPVLIRAAGPVLNNYGLTGATDPRLLLYNGATLVAENDDWDSSLYATFATLGAFPFTIASKDAAFRQSLTGPHTAQATVTNSGQILVEAYNAGPNDSRKLTNLSARFQVGTGDNILIAGFVLAGTGSRQILVRAVGPTLAGYGVPNTLADPQFSVFDGSTALATNNDWSASLASTFTTLGAFALDAGSKDAALVVTLDAGKAYTVQVSGVGNTTGEALVELYLVP